MSKGPLRAAVIFGFSVVSCCLWPRSARAEVELVEKNGWSVFTDGRFNGFLKATILRISEARDLGEFDRFASYESMKTYIAAPPDVLRCDEKNLREHKILNVCGVVITKNYKTDGIYLPVDDRRHYVA